ncbi:MAG: peptidylprolyl isomerase, partial [Thermoanaerobaculia bacterium]
ERGPALLALARAGDPRAGTLTGRLAAAEESDLRAAAATAAAVLGDQASLRRLYEDEAIAVRLAAVAASLEREEGDAAEWVAHGLADPSWVVRAATLEWLAEHPLAAVEELVTSAEEVARTDVWVAAIPALEARAETAGEKRGAAVEALQRLAVSSQFEVRRAAVGALQSLGLDAPAVGVVETGKALSDYREIAARTRGRPIAQIETTRGAFRLRLACPEAPLTCLNFVHLARQEYFDGVRFHRVVPNFVAQAGDPTGTGWGGPGYAIRDEANRRRYGRGMVGMALSGPDSGGSQFFVTLSPQPHLDGRYTLFAEVVDGMDVVGGLAQGDRIVGVRVLDSPAATFANARRSTR